MNTKQFIEKAKQVHGDKYDYSKVEYKSQKKVCIICPEHGEFWQLPGNHLQGKGCKECSKIKLSKKFSFTTEEFIEKAKQVHGDKYDYSKVEYKKYDSEVCIICPEHGEFWQRADSHLSGSGCQKCGRTKKLTTEEFIEKAKQVHGDKYDYSLSIYNLAHDKIKIICNKCKTIFEQDANAHLNRQGCPNCRKEKISESKKLTTEEFIEKAKQVHGDKYDYSKVEYKNSITKVLITCKKCRQSFLQTPHKHLSGHGCIYCNESKGEEKIRVILEKSNFIEGEDYIQQYKSNWLGRQSLDFFFPKLNIGIEYDGKQHFEPINRFGGVNEFNNIKERDIRKNILCENNNIKLIRIPYTEFNNIENILCKTVFFKLI